MDQKQISKFRTLLIEACDKHIASGGAITDSGFGSGHYLCPITCLVGYQKDGVYSQRIAEVAGLPIFPGDMWSFIRGFDNPPPNEDTDPHPNDLVKLGQELRQKYLPVPNKE